MNANYPANHQESRPDRDWTRLDGDPVSSAILVDALTSSSKPGGPSADGGEDCTDSDTRICTREPRLQSDPLANLDASVGDPNPAPTPPPTKDGAVEAEGLDCVLRAFLDAIAWGEGSNYRTVAFGTVYESPNYPNLVGKKNVSVPGAEDGTWPSDHPNIGVQAGKWKTHAAGRYQIMPKTWSGNGFAGMPFTPENQDALAVKLLNNLKVPDMLFAGNLGGAIHAIGGTWCSVPGAWGPCAPQPHRPLEDWTRIYNKSLRDCQD